MGTSLALMLIGVVGALLFIGDTTMMLISMLAFGIGGLGVQTGWAILKLAQRLARLEKDRDGAASSTNLREA
jgi:hypothetical protein